MKLNEEFLIKEIDNNLVITNLKVNNKVFVLNSMGLEIVNLINEGLNKIQIIQNLQEKYHATKEEIENDVETFLNKLFERGILIDK